MIMEHITTADAVEFVRSGPAGRLAATITPQHILLNRNSLFQVTASRSPPLFKLTLQDVTHCIRCKEEGML